MIDQSQFSDYLMQFKNKIASQVSQDASASSGPEIFNGASTANVKPLGFDKEKARAALKNLKTGSLTPKGSNARFEALPRAQQ